MAVEDCTPPFDVIEAGGGPAGLAAAVTASRQGARTLLIERCGFAGGMSTAALVNPWMAFHDRTGRRVVGTIAQEVVSRLVARGASPGHLRDTIGFVYSVTPFDLDHLRLLTDEMLRELGCSTLCHAEVIGVERSGPRVTGLVVQTSAGPRMFHAAVYVDATGDALLCHRTGLPMQTDATGRATQPMTMCFRMAGVDWDPIEQRMGENPSEFYEGTLVGYRPITGVSGFLSIWAEGGLPVPRDRLLCFAGSRTGQVYVNTSRTQGRDGTDPVDLSEAEIEGRQVSALVAFVRDRVPGFAASYLDALPTRVGVRETRRILGEHTLTAEDVMGGARFEDAVGRSAYPVDIHSSSNTGPMCSGAPSQPYAIPYRRLVPKGMDNLLVAGRCVSATHEGHASAGLTPTCFVTGEAAGAAAARGACRGVPVAEVEPQECEG